MARGELKSILKHGQVYGIANVANRGAALVLIPVYTHVLTPTEFGVYAGIAVLVDLLSALLGLGLGRALIRLFVERESEDERGAVLGTALATFLGLAAATAAVAYPLAVMGTRLALGDDAYALLVAVAVWGLILTTFVTIALNYLVVRKESVFFLGVSVLKATLFIALNLLFVVAWGWGVLGILLGTLISAAVVAAVLLVHVFRTSQLGVSAPVFRELILFGAPLVPAIFLDTAITSLDRLVLGAVQGAGSLGQYGLGLRLATALHLFLTSPFLQIWGVRQLEVLERDPGNQEIPRLFFVFTCGLTAVALGVALFAAEIVAVIASDAFADTASIIPFLAAAQVITAVRAFVETGVYHSKRTSILPVVGAVTLVLAGPFYWAGAQLSGATGVAAALCLVALVRTALIAVAARRHTGMLRLFPWWSLAATIGLALVVYLGVQPVLVDVSGLEAIAVKIAALAAFCAAAAFPFVARRRSGLIRWLQGFPARPADRPDPKEGI